jgi:hypothetical protein
VHDGTAKAHLHAWFWRGVKRVVVAIQAVQQRGFGRGLQRVGCVGSLVLWWVVIDVLRTWILIKISTLRLL